MNKTDGCPHRADIPYRMEKKVMFCEHLLSAGNFSSVICMLITSQSWVFGHISQIPTHEAWRGEINCPSSPATGWSHWDLVSYFCGRDNPNWRLSFFVPVVTRFLIWASSRTGHVSSPSWFSMDPTWCLNCSKGRQSIGYQTESIPASITFRVWLTTSPRKPALIAPIMGTSLSFLWRQRAQTLASSVSPSSSSSSPLLLLELANIN